MAAINSPNNGRKADKILRDALIAVQRQEPERLKRVALAWWEAAETDQQARNALADRLDGKAPQPIVGDDDHDSIKANVGIDVNWAASGNNPTT
jgi:hypothetical protein